MADSSQPQSPEDVASLSLQPCPSTANKKRKRRRRKHKADLRKEEQTTAGGTELELCELSSDEEQAVLNGR